MLIAEVPQPATTLMIILSPLLLCKLPLPELIVLPDILNQLGTVCIFWVGWKWMRWQWISLTIPSLEHVVDEEVIEANLGFWDWAGRPVKLGHHNWQALTKSFLDGKPEHMEILVKMGHHNWQALTHWGSLFIILRWYIFWPVVLLWRLKLPLVTNCQS